MTTRLLLPVASGREAARTLRDALRPSWRSASVALLALLVLAAAGLLVPPALGDLVDVVVAGGPESGLVAPLIVLGAAVVTQAVATGVGRARLVVAGEEALHRLRTAVMRSAFLLPRTEVEQAGTGDLVARTGEDVERVGEALRNGVPEALLAATTTVVTLLGLGLLDWRFALAGLTALPLQWLAARRYLRHSPALWARARRAETARTEQVVETVAGAATLQALAIGSEHLARVRHRSELARTAALRAIDHSAWTFVRIHAGEVVGTVAVLVTGAALVGAEQASVGEATAAALYFLRLFDPVSALLLLLDDLQDAGASLARVVGVVRAEPDPVVPPEGSPDPGRGLVLTGVRAGYRTGPTTGTGPDVLRGIDLVVPAGARLAVVGTSGAGKSTLAAVVAGVLPVRAGSLEVAGRLVAAGASTPPGTVVLVSQEVHVFAGTLAEDLRLVDPDADERRLLAALAVAGASAWAADLPEGLATPVGDGGHRLTPVQAQQVALARAWLSPAPVVVLDEATAEAGRSGGEVLEAALPAVLRGRTAVLVAHRLGLARTADLVAVVDGGVLVEVGPPQRLLAAAGAFTALAEAAQPASSARSSRAGATRR